MTTDATADDKPKNMPERMQHAMRGRNLYEWVDTIVEFIIRCGELLLLTAAFAYASKKANSPDLEAVAKVIQFLTAFYIFQGLGRFVGRMTLVLRPNDYSGRNAFVRPLVMAASGAMSVFIVTRIGSALQKAIDALVASSG